LQTTKRTLVFTVLALTVWAISTTAYASYYYTKYKQLEHTLGTMQSLVLKVNILIDYGEWNETQEWHNATLVPAGSTLFNATLAVAKVDSTPWGEYMLINSINGVENSQDTGWIWWIWDNSTSQWKPTLEAANKYVLADGETICWNYQNWASTSPPS